MTRQFDMEHANELIAKHTFPDLTGASKYDINVCMSYAAEAKWMDGIKYFESKGATYWNLGMESAAEAKWMDGIKYFASKGATNWNWGMEAAAKAKWMDGVKYFESKGATHWNLGMACSAPVKWIEGVEYFASKGATDVAVAAGDFEAREFIRKIRVKHIEPNADTPSNMLDELKKIRAMLDVVIAHACTH